MKDFQKLSVWQKSHQLTLESYRVTKAFPREEMFGLTSQIRRAAASVPANIAEGSGRSGDRELARFLTISAGSASELQYHFILAHDLGFLETSDFHQLDHQVNEVKRMLTGFINRLKAKG
jgi:four helix bundle protein